MPQGPETASGSSLENYSVLERFIDMILHQHQVFDRKRPNSATFGQLLLQINIESGLKAMGVAWI